MRIVVCAAAALVLAACAQKTEDAAPETAAADAVAAPAAEAAGQSDARSAAAARTAPVVPLARLAYSYVVAISAPAKEIRPLVDRHEAACMAAGPAVCQVTSASVDTQGADIVRGELKLRAQQDWLTGFRRTLGKDAEAAGGKLAQNDVETEDLSRQIVDTEAMLRSRTILRDRLENVLATRPGKLADLLEVEQELARVQGEIDALNSSLASMRTRVATSQLTIAYTSLGVVAPDGVFAPVREAVTDVVGLSVGTLAFLIRLIAIVGPLAALAGLLAWLMLRGRRKTPSPRLPAPAAE
jgi:hypothetical protein